MTVHQLQGRADLGNGMVAASHHPPLTINEQKRITAFNVKQTKALLKEVEDFKADPDKRERHVQEVCRACYYLSQPRFPKQTKVEYECAICKDPVAGTLRDIPRLCEECAQKHSLCMLCGGDQDLRTARRVWADDNEGEGLIHEMLADEPTGVEHSPDQTVQSSVGGDLSAEKLHVEPQPSEGELVAAE